MRVITFVGLPRSGKTHVITELIHAARRRGKRAGACWSAHELTYTMSKSLEDAARFRRANCERVCVRAKFETSFLHPEAFPLSKALESFRDCDYVFLEQDYFAPVPRIVCAFSADDAFPRMNRRTVAICGPVAGLPGIELPFPVFDVSSDADALLAHIDRIIPDIMPCSMLDELLPPVKGVSDDASIASGANHRDLSDTKEDLRVLVDGQEVKLTKAQHAAILTLIK